MTPTLSTATPATADLSLMLRTPGALAPGGAAMPLAAARQLALLFLDIASTPGAAGHGPADAEGLRGLFRHATRALRKGGSVAVPVDLWRLTAVAEALEAAGFKQLRYVRLDAADAGASPHRVMMILAVRGGGSTFHAAYHTGAFADARAGDERRVSDRSGPLGALVAQLLAIHTDPGDRVGAHGHLARILAQAAPAGEVDWLEALGEEVREAA